MWLWDRLAPEFKSIADFPRDNRAAFTANCRVFVRFYRNADLIAGELVAINGSKFEAVASSRKSMNAKKLKHQEAARDQRIARYRAQLDEADHGEKVESIRRSAVQTALRGVAGIKGQYQTCQGLMEAQGLVQHIMGESDAQKMRTSSGKYVAYNIQSAVDAEYCLTLHQEVTQDGADRQLLEPAARASRNCLAVIVDQADRRPALFSGLASGAAVWPGISSTGQPPY
jgi:hypothetical protein